MYCRHQLHFRVLGCFLLIFLIGGGIGGLSASLGKTIIGGADALDGREEKLLESAKKRRERLTKRKQSSVHAQLLNNLSDKQGVSLRTGELSYPRLGILAPIGKASRTEWEHQNWRAVEEQIQFGLLHGVVAYPHSPSPGKPGNIVIAGHSAAPTPEVRGSLYENVFAKLPEASKGDTIELRDQSGQASVYEVYETGVIPTTKTSILEQDTHVSALTLFTCYPVGTTRERFMVKARLLLQ